MHESLARAWHDPRDPLGSHVGLIVLFNAALGATLFVASRRRLLPKRPSGWDVALLGAGTYKVSRLVATDLVTSPLRIPFTDEKPDAEDVEPAGRGLRRALGELLTCPHCVAPWSALALGAGLLFFPRPTRFACGLFSAMALSDVMHRSYSMLQRRQQQLQRQAEGEPGEPQTLH